MNSALGTSLPTCFSGVCSAHDGSGIAASSVLWDAAAILLEAATSLGFWGSAACELERARNRKQEKGTQ